MPRGKRTYNFFVPRMYPAIKRHVFYHEKEDRKGIVLSLTFFYALLSSKDSSKEV